MAVSEKIQLLGKDVYTDIPNELTLTDIPTASELDYVGSEDFDDVMLTKILPQCIKEPIEPKHLLEIDYQWILRCLRFINYGPYAKVGAIFCEDCETTSRGEYQVNLETVACKPLPEGFTNSMIISKDEFLDYNKDIEIHLLTIQEVQNSRKDEQFKTALGQSNTRFARMCYMIKSIGGQRVDPVAARLEIQKSMSSADYRILREVISNLEDYGLRGGGTVVCPKCKSPNAHFISFINEAFFRPDVDCLRQWGMDRNKQQKEELPRAETRSLRQNSR